VPVLTPSDLPALTIVKEARFDGSALYGHINGGADLFFEYGFISVTVQKVRLGRGEYTVEIYRMTDDTAAMGLSSIRRSRSLPVDSLGPLFCASRYHAQGAAGPWFVRVVTATGTEVAEAGVRALAGAVRRKLPSGTAPIPPVIAAIAPSPIDVMFIRGELGLGNGFDVWSRLLDGVEGYRMFLLPLSFPEGEAIVADMRFAREADRTRFVQRVSSDRPYYVRHWARGSGRFVYLQASFRAESLAGRIQSALEHESAVVAP
jgi:hypothetical protein